MAKDEKTTLAGDDKQWDRAEVASLKHVINYLEGDGDDEDFRTVGIALKLLAQATRRLSSQSAKEQTRVVIARTITGDDPARFGELVSRMLPGVVPKLTDGGEPKT